MDVAHPLKRSKQSVLGLQSERGGFHGTAYWPFYREPRLYRGYVDFNELQYDASVGGVPKGQDAAVYAEDKAKRGSILLTLEPCKC